MADAATGKKTIQILHQELRLKNPQIPASFDEFNEILRRTYFPRDVSEAPAGYSMAYYPKSSQAAYDLAVANMGGFIVDTYDLSDAEIRTSMKALAAQTNGNIPEKFAYINGAFSGVMSEVKFFPMASFVLTESAKTIATGVEKAGETVLTVGEGVYKIKEYLLPIGIGVGVLALLVFAKSLGGKVGYSVQKVAEAAADRIRR